MDPVRDSERLDFAAQYVFQRPLAQHEHPERWNFIPQPADRLKQVGMPLGPYEARSNATHKL